MRKSRLLRGVRRDVDDALRIWEEGLLAHGCIMRTLFIEASKYVKIECSPTFA